MVLGRQATEKSKCDKEVRATKDMAVTTAVKMRINPPLQPRQYLASEVHSVWLNNVEQFGADSGHAVKESWSSSPLTGGERCKVPSPWVQPTHSCHTTDSLHSVSCHACTQ